MIYLHIYQENGKQNALLTTEKNVKWDNNPQFIEGMVELDNSGSIGKNCIKSLVGKIQAPKSKSKWLSKNDVENYIREVKQKDVELKDSGEDVETGSIQDSTEKKPDEQTKTPDSKTMEFKPWDRGETGKFSMKTDSKISSFYPDVRKNIVKELKASKLNDEQIQYAMEFLSNIEKGL